MPEKSYVLESRVREYGEGQRLETKASLLMIGENDEKDRKVYDSNLLPLSPPPSSLSFALTDQYFYKSRHDYIM